MKKYILTAFAFAALLGGSVTFTSCEDEATVQEMELGRLLSPTNLVARVRNTINIELSWNAVSNAQSYTIEVFNNDPEFAGSPIQTIETGNLSYLISGLDGEETYNLRVKATAEGENDSKWSSIERITEPAQMFFPLEEEDITFHSVTLRWPAGETVTTITLTPTPTKENPNPTAIVHTVTPAEIATGEVTIDDLPEQTDFVAVMVNGEKTRGTMPFTTAVDLTGKTAVEPDMDFVSMLQSAAAGEVFAFFPGTYTSIESPITINQNIEIIAATTKGGILPVLNASLALTNGASITIRNMVLDGEGTDGPQAIDFKTSGVIYNSLTIEGCEVRNYVKGFVYINAATVELVNINNCLIHHVECNGGDFIDCRTGYIKVLNLTNSTIYDSAIDRDFIRMDDASATFAGVTPLITVDHCTINNSSSGSTSRRLLYVRFKGNSITFTNNLVSNSKGVFTNQANTNVTTFGGNNYFAAEGYMTATVSNAINDVDGTQLDPQYTDPANGDFTVGNQDVIDTGAGDPRWLP